MGCVNGVIKFVAMAGYYEEWNIDDLVLESWMLTPDLKEWKAGTSLPLRDLLGERELSCKAFATDCTVIPCHQHQ
ncbi:hypothetical protein BAE44_0008622 [Dichanthelium oligosanthes]|uniref:DUF1618 domain-containing protein n=1 Tax=Dichanthelium oligosanthes TaxID=888268 RepID=A0A1E5VZ20_9POAL|nr:hypothetical protein BAE44_0008622 [Dichanthelium oligosanthes]